MGGFDLGGFDMGGMLWSPDFFGESVTPPSVATENTQERVNGACCMQ